MKRESGDGKRVESTADRYTEEVNVMLIFRVLLLSFANFSFVCVCARKIDKNVSQMASHLRTDVLFSVRYGISLLVIASYWNHLINRQTQLDSCNQLETTSKKKCLFAHIALLVCLRSKSTSLIHSFAIIVMFSVRVGRLHTLLVIWILVFFVK